MCTSLGTHTSSNKLIAAGIYLLALALCWRRNSCTYAKPTSLVLRTTITLRLPGRLPRRLRLSAAAAWPERGVRT